MLQRVQTLTSVHFKFLLCILLAFACEKSDAESALKELSPGVSVNLTLTPNIRYQHSTTFGDQAILTGEADDESQFFISAEPFNGHGNSLGPWENLKRNIQQVSNTRLVLTAMEGKKRLSDGLLAEYKLHKYEVGSLAHEQLYVLISREGQPRYWLIATSETQHEHSNWPQMVLDALSALTID